MRRRRRSARNAASESAPGPPDAPIVMKTYHVGSASKLELSRLSMRHPRARGRSPSRYVPGLLGARGRQTGFRAPLVVGVEDVGRERGADLLVAGSGQVHAVGLGARRRL